MTCHTRIPMSLVLLAAAAATTAAHPILIHTGTIEWIDEELRITFDLDDHSLEHESAPLAAEVSPRRIARHLARSVRLVSHDCRHFTPDRITVVDDVTKVVSEYSIPRDVETLALIHGPGHELVSLARQIQLRWSPPGENLARLLRLTSAGNHAVIRRGVSGPGPASHDPFSQVVLAIDRRRPDRAVRVHIDIPCLLLATWPALLQCGNASITTGAFRDHRRHIVDWVRDHLSLRAPSGRTPQSTIEDAHLVGPSGERLPEATNQTYSAYTTRVRVQLRCLGARRDPWTEVTWKGFNAVVLSARVIRVGEHGQVPVGVITSVQATTRIEHTPPYRASIR